VAKKLTYTEATPLFVAPSTIHCHPRHVPKIGELTRRCRVPKDVRSACSARGSAHFGAPAKHIGSSSRAPFWAVPTAFHVQSAKRLLVGIVRLGRLAIPLMLRRDARVTPRVPAATPPWSLSSTKEVSRNERRHSFAVPASRWYENIVFNLKDPCCSSGRKSTSPAGAASEASARGCLLLQQGLRLAKAWYGDRFRPSGVPSRRNKPRPH